MNADKTLIAVNERAFNYLAHYARTDVVPFLRTHAAATLIREYRLQISGH